MRAHLTIAGAFGAGALAILIAGPALATPGGRVALVIGNGDYARVQHLSNPVNDAHAVAEELRKLGFDVIERQNLDGAGLRQALGAFHDKLTQGPSASLFFYAGHGLQIQDTNYLLSVKADIKTENDVRFGVDSVKLSDFLDVMNEAGGTKYVLLDACRNNPFEQELKRSLGTRAIAMGLGLAAEKTGDARNRLIAYATVPGATAEDGNGDHSPFTKALLARIDTPDESFGKVLMDVVGDVRKATDGRQNPHIDTTLTDDIVLRSSVAPPAGSEVTTGEETSSPQGKDDDELWSSVRDSSDPEDFRFYLDHFPKGRYYNTAAFRLKKLLAAAPSEANAAPSAMSPSAMSPSAMSQTAANQTTTPQTTTPQTTIPQTTTPQTLAVRITANAVPANAVPVAERTPEVEAAPASASGTEAATPAEDTAASDVAEASRQFAPRKGAASGTAAGTVPGAPAQSPEPASLTPAPGDKTIEEMNVPVPGTELATLAPMKLDEGNREAYLVDDKTLRREIQGRLTSIGFDTGGTDGTFGPRTRSAISEWQRSVGLQSTSFMSVDDFHKLREASSEIYARWLIARHKAASNARFHPEQLITGPVNAAAGLFGKVGRILTQDK